MHQAAVVPDEHIPRAPAVAINELRTGGVLEEERQQGVALLRRKAFQVGGEPRVHEQGFAARLRVSNHYRMDVAILAVEIPLRDDVR